MNGLARRTIPLATMEEVQPDTFIATYSGERIVLSTSMDRKQFNEAKRKIDTMLMRVSTAHATANVGRA